MYGGPRSVEMDLDFPRTPVQSFSTALLCLNVENLQKIVSEPWRQNPFPLTLKMSQQGAEFFNYAISLGILSECKIWC